MNYLIDSDWVIDYLKGTATADQLLESLVRPGIAISLITFGEIYEGIYFGRDSARHEQIFQAFLEVAETLPLTLHTLKLFAQIRGELRAKGQIIGDLDILIAATAIEHNLTLVTQNRRHFDRISNLKIYG
ncbi:MAG: type II toxin-antitoxin system VapC family toxin [Caldilineaceae bacterium]|nr:type II toxin-antitoxin system VapC family toxin [Caldilineaceae bacterium]